MSRLCDGFNTKGINKVLGEWKRKPRICCMEAATAELCQLIKEGSLSKERGHRNLDCPWHVWGTQGIHTSAARTEWWATGGFGAEAMKSGCGQLHGASNATLRIVA